MNNIINIKGRLYIDGRDMTDIINFILYDIGRNDYNFTMSIDDAIRNLHIIREAGYKIPAGMDAETFMRIWNLLE